RTPPSYRSTCRSRTCPRSVAWANPSNAQTSDNVYATAASTANGQWSNFLKCTNFGFGIPSGGTIAGIQVEWQYKNPGCATVKDKAARIVTGGTIGALAADRSSTGS